MFQIVVVKLYAIKCASFDMKNRPAKLNYRISGKSEFAGPRSKNPTLCLNLSIDVQVPVGTVPYLVSTVLCSKNILSSKRRQSFSILKERILLNYLILLLSGRFLLRMKLASVVGLEL